MLSHIVQAITLGILISFTSVIVQNSDNLGFNLVQRNPGYKSEGGDRKEKVLILTDSNRLVSRNRGGAIGNYRKETVPSPAKAVK